MASNAGRFIDRNPIICAAGKSNNITETVADCLKRYTLEDEVDALKHEAGVFEEFKPLFRYKLKNTGNLSHRGIYTEMQPILQPPVKTRYQTLINDLKETAYSSYWNKEQGRGIDPTPGLPAGMEPLGKTFGTPSIKEYNVKELVNPPKTVYEVLWDSQVGHELYKKTHDDYNPAEQVNRKYLKPAYNPNTRFGMRTGQDPRGIWVRCALDWKNNEPVTCVSSIQADINERKKPRVGKVLAPNNNIACVPKGHRFGLPSDRPVYGVEDLLKDADCPPCLFKRQFEEWMRNLNEFRCHLKDLYNALKFDYNDFEAKVLFYDKEITGWISLDLFYQICKCNGLEFEKETLEPFLNFVGVIKDGQINYRDFMFLANINNSVPEIIKIENVPKKNQYYESASKAEACDFIEMDNTNKPAAGVPSFRFDIPYTPIPVGACLADVDSLGSETSAGALINPSIYMLYGLSHRDFKMPRSPDVIKKMFEKLGYQFPDDTFTKLWNIALKRDNNGGVCVDTFKKLMNETIPPSEYKVTKTDLC